MADGIYAGTLPADIPVGHCTLSIRLGTFDTADDPDNKPEQRIPAGATLTLTPNVTGPVILSDGTIMVIKGTVLTSDTGEFDFWAIDGMNASINPTGWNWTATLKIDWSTQVKFTFSPDSTSATPLNLGRLIPISDPQTGVATVVGRGVASISVDPDTRHVLFVMSDDTTYDAGAIPPGPPGDDGRGIASVTVDPDTRHMILTMSDNTTYDAGEIPPGPPGPANALSIGTVTQGATAHAQITGESPEQTLNLTIPKGDAGPANTLTIGTVTQGTAAATITGASPNQTLNLVVPKGDPGPPNTLSIGTVTTGATGTNAAATITGTAPSQTLNLTIPKGEKGDPGSGGGGTNTHTGTGFPAAGLGAVGDTYLDTAATSGALIWRKWPNGWRVQEGDTGWRNITALWGSSALNVPLSGSSVRIRRVNSHVTLNYYFQPGAAGEVPASVFGGVEFFPAVQEFWLHALGHGLLRGDVIGTAWRASAEACSIPGSHFRGTTTYLPQTNNWPSTLPGTPA